MPGDQTVSESSTTTTSVAGSEAASPAAIAARLPALGTGSTRSQYSAAIAATGGSPPSTPAISSRGSSPRTLASARRNTASGSRNTGTSTVTASGPGSSVNG